jgi:hypothetical protein
MKRLIVGLLLWCLACLSSGAFAVEKAAWRDKFDVEQKNFSATGKNAYFILEPGYQLVYDRKEGSKKIHLTITVLDETKIVDGVETRVVEEKETHDGEVAEISRNYFAIDAINGDVYYFGEDVDEYTDGKIAGHGGSWLSGVNGAHYGLMMPVNPKAGDRYYQEIAPKVASDRAEIVSVTESVNTPAGTFQKCVKTEETTPLEPKSKGYKLYAPGIGLISDGSLMLVKYGQQDK